MKKLGRRHIGDAVTVVAVTAVAALFLFGTGGGGTRARIIAPGGETVLDLSDSREMAVTGRDGITLIIETVPGAVRVKDANCPDKLCVGAGFLRRAGDTAVCMPAGITVTVEGDSEYDAISR